MNKKVDVYLAICGSRNLDGMRKDVQDWVCSLSAMTKGKQWSPETWERTGFTRTLWMSKDGYHWDVEFQAGSDNRPFMKKIWFKHEPATKLVVEVDSKSGLLEFLYFPASSVMEVYNNLQGLQDGLVESCLSLHHDLLPFEEAAKHRFQ